MQAAHGAHGLVNVGPPTDLLGITPVDVARAAGHTTLTDMLQQHYYGKQTGSSGDKRTAKMHAQQKSQ